MRNSNLNTLYHHGIKGQKWGIRRFQNKDGSLTPDGKIRYYEDSNVDIITNSDGSKTIPKGFTFNRVGKTSLDVNPAGSLYVSYGKDDAARYVRNLGPTPIGKLMGTAAEAVQHVHVKRRLTMPSNDTMAIETAKLLMSNKSVMDHFSKSIYSMTVDSNDPFADVTSDHLKRALKNPGGRDGQRLAYSVSTMLGDPNFKDDAKAVYDHFRKLGYSAIPDLHDIMSGTSKTAIIVLDPSAVEVTSYSVITPEIMKDAKRWVKSIEKLKVDELLK